MNAAPSLCSNARLQIASLLVEVVLVSAYGQLVASCFVANHDSVWVHLEHRRSPLVADIAVDAMLEGTSLVVTRAYEEHFLRIHHGADTDSQRLLWYEAEVVVEEAAVGVDSVSSQRLDTCARSQRRTWLVESEVSVRTDTAHEEVNTTSFCNHFLVVVALGDEVRSVTIEDVHVLWLDVDVVEEVVPHEAVVAFWVINRQFHILVHVERDDVLERDLASTAHVNQIAVQPEW